MTTLAEQQLIEAHSILCTAAESGIGYWCLLRDYNWSEDEQGNLLIEPLAGWEQNDRDKNDPAFDDAPQFIVSAGKLLEAIKRLTPDKNMPYHWRLAAIAFLAKPDASEWDAEGADVLFQYAALGSIIYG